MATAEQVPELLNAFRGALAITRLIHHGGFVGLVGCLGRHVQNQSTVEATLCKLAKALELVRQTVKLILKSTGGTLDNVRSALERYALDPVIQASGWGYFRL